MTKSGRMMVSPLGSATLQRVDDGLALGFGGLEFVEVLAVDEETTEDADEQAGEEGVDVGHGIRLG